MNPGAPSIPDLLHSIEKKITSTEEHNYFLIHVARYRFILEQINQLTIQREQQNNEKNTRLPARQGSRNTCPPELTLRRSGREFGMTKEKLRILDVGCFPYHHGAALEAMGHTVYGISSQHEPIKKKNIAVLNIETDRFPYADNTFDLVLCSEVLEHLPQSPIRALAQMQRVTKPGGHLLLTTPNIARSINRGKLLLGRSIMYPVDAFMEDDYKGSNLYHRHNHEYTMNELCTVLKAASWGIAKKSYEISYTPDRKRPIPDPLWLRAGKYVNYLTMLATPSLRDTLLIVGVK